MPQLKTREKAVPFSEEEYRAASWCMNNGIKISPISAGRANSKYFVDIDNKGKRTHNGKQYSRYDAYRLMYEYYMYYYKKYAKK